MWQKKRKQWSIYSVIVKRLLQFGRISLSQFPRNVTVTFMVTNFEKLFGICRDNFVTVLLLLLKYHMYTCKFNNNVPNIVLFKSFVKKQKDIKYFIAKKRNKLPAHFKKWRFDIDINCDILHLHLSHKVEMPWYIGLNPWLWIKGFRVRFPSMPGTFCPSARHFIIHITALHPGV